MKNMIKTKKVTIVTAMAVCMVSVAVLIAIKLLGVSFAGSNVGQGDTVKIGNGKYKIISEYDSFAQYIGPTKNSVKTVAIPDTIKAGGKTYKVVSIGDEAFSYSCNTLKKVTIGRNVVGIGEMAFRYCKKLKTITIKTTHLTSGNVKPGAFYKMNDKVVITVPKQKLTEYKKILEAKNIGVTGKKQKIKGKVMTGEDGFTNTVYDSDAKIPVPEVAMGLDTAIDFRKMQTKEAEYSVGDTIPIAMKVKMPQELFGYWNLYMMDKGKTYLECGVCGRMFEPYHESFSFENFWLHTYIPINDECDCTVNNNIFGTAKHTFLAWQKVFYKTPCKATFKVTLSDAENGIMQFSEECMESSSADQDGYHMVQVNDDGDLDQIENDGSIWAFNAGDQVEVELLPIEGYNVKNFTIKSADTGDVMAHKETMDNIFSFTMPSQSLSIEATFRLEDKRADLTDSEAIALQERIDALPEEEGFYESYEQMDETELQGLWDETNNIGESYFNEFSNEQREQVDASKLYSTLLLLGGYQEGAGEVIPDSNEAEELQNKINALANVQDIAETTDINELGCANYCYSNAETTVMIPENQQDDIFLDVLELSETVSEIEPGYAGENFDLEPLSSLVMFFTSGYSAKASGILDSDDPFSPVGKFGIYPTKGSYTADAWDPAHYSSRFSLKATMKDKDTGTDEKHNTVAYCANPSRARYHKGSQKTTKFKASDLKEIANGVDNMAALKIKLILWYGFDGPGYGKDGAPEVSYAATHFALGKEYANDTGDESKTHASKTKWKELYNFAKEKAKDIKKDRLDLPSTGKLGKDEIDFLNFRVFVVVPPDSEKYQHIFFYSDNAEDQSIDPMQLYLYKVEDDSTKGTKVAGSTLVKAEFVVNVSSV